MATTGRMITSAAVAALLMAAAGAFAQTVQPQSCEDYRCQFQQMIEQSCPCTGNSNHGRYVSCVAHVINDLVDQGLPTNCKGKLKRCAARSVCGKQDHDFHTCTRFEYGTCLTTDTLTGQGTCEHDPTIACTSDTDCVVSSRCKTMRGTERCNGPTDALDLSPTCCSTCTTAP
jgi:hypothetical protein